MMCLIFIEKFLLSFFQKALKIAYLLASSTATAHATVIPTMGLLPAPIKPIISTSKCLRHFAKGDISTVFTHHVILIVFA